MMASFEFTEVKRVLRSSEDNDTYYAFILCIFFTQTFNKQAVGTPATGIFICVYILSSFLDIL